MDKDTGCSPLRLLPIRTLDSLTATSHLVSFAAVEMRRGMKVPLAVQGHIERKDTRG
ncbi:Uncharacterized protein DAT39_007741, partial [Clarias magur]